MSLHLNRVNEAVGHEISRALRIYFREEAANITIVGAQVSSDLRLACVKFSVIGDDAARSLAARFFAKRKNFIKKKLCDRIRMRRVPELRFEMTDAIAHGNDLIELLDGIAEGEM
ncbi:MAG: ribosome-binding factor A [Puniceicoccales bacterium]|jgi:ribosome-binding factor A|nr:ribosome-binding factor A [Puniceicoccales bacterium]